VAVIDCRSCATPIPAGARFCSGCGIDVTDPAATVVNRPRDPMAELQDRLTRTLAGRYEVRKLLGAGGMAAVFLADEIGLDRPVAIKVLPPELSRDEGLVARFQREAKTAAKLDHPHIIPIHRVESEAGLHYFVMKYVPGRSLESLLEGAEPMAIDLALRVLREAAGALGHAHARGVVHRDVKPANIMLDQDGRVVLTDFGISKAGETSSLTQTGMIIGTPHYMSPEQALGSAVDGRADQYSLAVVAYEMLARQCPFTGESAHTILYRHIHEVPKPITALRSDISQHVADAISIALAKNPNDRFAKMEEFARALGGDQTAFAARPSIVTAPMAAVRQPTQRGRTARQSARARVATPVPERRTGARVAAAVAILLALVGGWYAMSGPGRPSTFASENAGSGTGVEPAGLVPAPPPPAPDSGGATAATPDSTPTAPLDAPVVAPAPDEPQRTSPPRTTQQRGRQSRPPAREAERPEPVARTTTLTVASDPYGTLYVDGVEVGLTPITDYQLVVGRSYQIRIERDGYQTKRETIRAEDPNPIRRRYILDPGGPR
jgi:serine/threonine-protein kinase